jgi:hypothetical protein
MFPLQLLLLHLIINGPVPGEKREMFEEEEENRDAEKDGAERRVVEEEDMLEDEEEPADGRKSECMSPVHHRPRHPHLCQRGCEWVRSQQQVWRLGEKQRCAWIFGGKGYWHWVWVWGKKKRKKKRKKMMKKKKEKTVS